MSLYWKVTNKIFLFRITKKNRCYVFFLFFYVPRIRRLLFKFISFFTQVLRIHTAYVVFVFHYSIAMDSVNDLCLCIDHWLTGWLDTQKKHPYLKFLSTYDNNTYVIYECKECCCWFSRCFLYNNNNNLNNNNDIFSFVCFWVEFFFLSLSLRLVSGVNVNGKYDFDIFSNNDNDDDP